MTATSRGHREQALPHAPVTILTGFLGSGKTTLLNRALSDPKMSRTAVVINEFGEVGLDHKLVTTSDDAIMVLENGCLCCTVFGDLVATLNRLYHAREAKEIPDFERVVIETSGLADPAPVLQAFLSDPTLAGLYRIGAVIAVVDAVNGPATLDNHSEAVRQIALADHILITKRDLLPADRAQAEADALATRLRRINPAARIVWSDASGFDAVTLLQASGFDLNPPRPTCAPGSTKPPMPSTTTRTIMIMGTTTTAIMSITTACMTATSPRSASCASSPSRARRCAFCSTRCSRISGRICCG
ncbi:MAG: hypothetical protein GHHEDOFH_02036 [Pseudorhodoplanes sp.]|nr:hypothetical protein [Pseudorhodoplanes sp.]